LKVAFTGSSAVGHKIVVAAGETRPCTAYVWPSDKAPLLTLDAPWSYDDFRRKDLPEYLVMTEAVRAEFEQSYPS